MKNKKRNIMLTVLSIIFLISGCSGIVSSIMELSKTNDIMIVWITSIIFNAFQIIAGLVGFVFAGTPEKAKKCVGLGFITIIVNLVLVAVQFVNIKPYTAYLSATANTDVLPAMTTAMIVISFIFTIILQILYIVAAGKSKKMINAKN